MRPFYNNTSFHLSCITPIIVSSRKRFKQEEIIYIYIRTRIIITNKKNMLLFVRYSHGTMSSLFFVRTMSTTVQVNVHAQMTVSNLRVLFLVILDEYKTPCRTSAHQDKTLLHTHDGRAVRICDLFYFMFSFRFYFIFFLSFFLFCSFVSNKIDQIY